MINDDDAIISDPDWQETTLSALDEKEGGVSYFETHVDYADAFGLAQK